MNQIETDMSLEESKTQIRTAIYQRWIENHPNYSKTDAYHRLNREGQTIIFRLRSGHNRLKKHMHTKFKIGTSPNCPCGNIAQTAEHILQVCPLHAELRQQNWPKPSTLDDKLNGTEYNLTQTVEFIKATGLQIWQDANIMGTQKKKRKEDLIACRDIVAVSMTSQKKRRTHYWEARLFENKIS